jgi:hypothetical protein
MSECGCWSLHLHFATKPVTHLANYKRSELWWQPYTYATSRLRKFQVFDFCCTLYGISKEKWQIQRALLCEALLPRKQYWPTSQTVLYGVQLVSTVNLCLWQVQGSSRCGAQRMWYCDNMCWSCRGADREWAQSPGVGPHHSDISGQPHHEALLTHSSSWISHAEYNDRNATSQWRETVSITTG